MLRKSKLAPRPDESVGRAGRAIIWAWSHHPFPTVGRWLSSRHDELNYDPETEAMRETKNKTAMKKPNGPRSHENCDGILYGPKSEPEALIYGFYNSPPSLARLPYFSMCSELHVPKRFRV